MLQNDQIYCTPPLISSGVKERKYRETPII
jgi:hypothetical protein